MKKLLLAIAVSSAAGVSQATSYQASEYSGTFNQLEFGTVYADGGIYQQHGYADLDYQVTVLQNVGTFISLSVVLDGVYSTVGDASLPAFVQQTFTFDNAVFQFDKPNTDGIISIVGDYEFTAAEIATNGGAGGDYAQKDHLPGGVLQSGNVSCLGGSCDSFDPTNIDYLSLAHLQDFGTNWEVLSHSLQIELTSLSGNTVYRLSSVPVPAAAWLFGSALLGLASIRKHKALNT